MTFAKRMARLADRMVNQRDWHNRVVWRKLGATAEDHQDLAIYGSALTPLDGARPDADEREFDQGSFMIAQQSFQPKRQDLVQFGAETWEPGGITYRVTRVQPFVTGDQAVAYRIEVER